MRKGSLEYWPHRRAIKQMPRVRSTPVVNEASLLSFAAFKVGMTHVMMTDDSESPAKGTEVARAVTVLEIPRIFVYGARFYKNSYSSYKTVAGEAYDMALAANVGIKKAKKNDINAFKNDLANMIDVTMLAYLDPENLGFANKKIMRFEIHVGGKNATERFGFIESHIGKELKVANFIKAGDYIDVSSISKGKGWAGVIKRFGVSRQYRKATGKVRHVGTLGAWRHATVEQVITYCYAARGSGLQSCGMEVGAHGNRSAETSRKQSGAQPLGQNLWWTEEQSCTGDVENKSANLALTRLFNAWGEVCDTFQQHS